MHGLDLFLGMMSRQWWMAIREAPRSFVLLLAVLVSSPRAASGWQTRITGSGGGPGAALSVRADAGGDVVAAGFIDNGGASGADFAVVKLASATGTEVWRQVLVGPAANDGAAALAFDAAGNPVVVGTTSALGVDRQFTVAKLASGDGHIVWRTDPVDLQDAGGFAVTVDGAGNVVAAGDRGFTVIKLDGATGAEMWRSAPLTGAAFAVATDAHDDIVAAGTLGFFNDTFAVKLAGTTGDQIWAQGFSQLDGRLFVVVNSVDAIVGRFLPPDESLTSEVAALSLTDGTPHWKAKVPGQIFALELRPTGDVIVGSGSTASDTQTGNALVSELAATDGGQIWARMFEPGVGPEIPVPASLGLDASGDVVFAGTLAGGAAGHDLFPGFSAAKLGGADGTEAWRRSDNGAVVPGIFVVRALTLAGTSRIVVAGAGRSAPDGPTAFALLGLSANDGALDLCGDGYRDAGEQCDDGNLVGDDCCSAACHTVGRDGQGCAPATACTIEATCHGGTCSGRALPCEPCGSCDPASGCRAALSRTPVGDPPRRSEQSWTSARERRAGATSSRGPGRAVPRQRRATSAIRARTAATRSVSTRPTGTACSTS